MIVDSLFGDIRALEYGRGMPIRASEMKKNPLAIRRRVTSNISFVKRLCVSRILEGAQGCVNTCGWNEAGDLLAASGDDLHVQIWRGPRFDEQARIATGHTRNVFCAKFVPQSGDTDIVTAAMDGDIRITNIESQQSTGLYSYDKAFAMKFAFVPNCPDVFVSTHGDGLVNMIDIRSPDPCLTLLEPSKQAFGISFDPMNPTHFAVGFEDHAIRVFDIRKFSMDTWNDHPLKLFVTPEHLEQFGGLPQRSRQSPVTVSDVTFSSKRELLANFSNDSVVLFDCNVPANATHGDNVFSSVLMTYKERSNEETFLKEANFMNDEAYVVTGGDSGCLYAWEKYSGKLCLAAHSDTTILNGVSPHPRLPMLATCGIDSNVKVLDLDLESSEVDYDEEVRETDRVDMMFSEVLETGHRFLDRFLASMLGQDSPSSVVTHKNCLALVERMKQKKEEGNELFRDNDFRGALDAYQDIVGNLKVYGTSPHLSKEMAELLKAALLNKAACYGKLEEWDRASSECKRVLRGDPHNLKATYRLAESLLRLDRPDLAGEHVVKAIQHAPDDQNIRRLHAEWVSKLGESEQDK